MSPQHPLEQCPRCDRRLGPPLKSSGRQVCAGCGWSDKPRSTAQTNADTMSLDDIKQLLKQAEAKSLENMKPRKKQLPVQNPLEQ